MRVRPVLLLLVALTLSPAGNLIGLFGTGHTRRQVVVSSRALPTTPASLPTTSAPPPSSTPASTVAPASPPPPPSPVPEPPNVTWTIARVRPPGLDVYADPASPGAALHVSDRTDLGSARVLPVVGQRGDWFQVRVPARPNNAIGWVKIADVDVGTVKDRILVSLFDRKLRWFHGDAPVLETTVGVGSPRSPTPPGEYYVTDILPSSGAYGPWIIALNGHSDVLTDFEGGDPWIGIHGTNNAATIGAAVSWGCVHVPNGIDSMLASVIQPGTVVEIG